MNVVRRLSGSTWRRIGLALVFITAAGALFWIVIVAPSLIYPPLEQPVLSHLNLTDKEQLDAENARLQIQGTTRATLVQILGGLTVVSGAVLAWRQFVHIRYEAAQQREAKREDFRLDLFAEALKSLAATAVDVRIGGIYALARLADMSTAHRTACADVLSAYVRTNSPWPPRPPRPDQTAILSADTGKSLRDYAPDVQTALTLIGKHTYLWHEVDYIRFRHIDLRKANLTGGHFEGAAFTESHLEGAYMDEANFNGASFRGASLVGARLNSAILDNCNLRDTDLRDAILDAATMTNATFDSRTHWPTNFSPQEALAKGAREVSRSDPATSADPVGVKAE